MNSSSTKQLTTSLAVAASAGGVAYALYRLHCNVKTTKQDLSKPVDDESNTAVSHLHLEVEDLEKSKRFYLDFGFIHEEEESKTDYSITILKVPGGTRSGGSQQKPHEPYVLLEENKRRTRRIGHAAAAGYARMCLLVENCDQESHRLSKLGYKPVAPAVTDRPGNPTENNPPVTIVAYIDPDGNLLELVSLTGTTAFMLQAMSFTGVVRFPMWVHVNINATSYDISRKAYQALGFTVMGTDYGKVENHLYQALAIPNPGIAKQVSLIKLPNKNQNFMIDLIEWQDPKTERPEIMGSSMRLALTVDDVAFKLDQLLHSGECSNDGEDYNDKPALPLWSVVSTPTCVDLPPPLGRAVRCTVKDSDGALVDLVSYPEKSILLETNARILRGSLLASDAKKKIVLVTGCDSGFGRSVTIQMAGLGFKVVAVCYTHDGAAFLSSIATTVVADLTTDTGLKDVVNTVLSAVGGRDTTTGDGAELWALVNNAGMHMPGHVEWIPPEAYKRVMALNFHAPVYLIHELLPLLRQSKGRVINVSSVCGIVCAPSNSTYSASKFALEALSDALRVENKPFGVDIIVVEPTTMRTSLALDWYKAWTTNFKAAPPQKRPFHSDKWAEGMVRTGNNMLEAVAEDPRITVGEMVNALVMKDPPARILSGAGAKGYKQLSQLPESVRDKIFYVGPDPGESDKGFEAEYFKKGTKAGEAK